MLELVILCASLLLQAPAGDDLAAARAKLAAGQADEAMSMLSGLLERHEGSDRDVRLLLADAEVQAGQPERAAATLEPLLEQDDYDVLLAAGKAFMAWGDQMSARGKRAADTDFAYESARGHFEHADRVAPPDRAEASIELGYFETYTAGDPAAAIARADALLAKNAQNGEALLLRGCAGLQLAVAAANGGDAEQAAPARQRAVKDLLEADELLGKTRPEPWVQLAWLYEADDQPVKAVEAAVTRLQRDPSADFAMLYHLASRYAGQQQFDAAGAALTAMVQRDAAALTDLLANDEARNDTALHFAWVTGPLVQSQRFAEARDLLAPVIAADPQNADVWNNYGFVCREVGQSEEAYRAYTKALSLDPNNPRLLNDTGVMLHYYLHRDYDKAQELYEKAVEQADEGLARTDLDATAKTDLQDARKDAVGNLKKLAANDYTWQG